MEIERKDGPTALIFSRQNLPRVLKSKFRMLQKVVMFLLRRAESNYYCDWFRSFFSTYAQLDGVRVVSMPCAEENKTLHIVKLYYQLISVHV